MSRGLEKKIEIAPNPPKCKEGANLDKNKIEREERFVDKEE